MIEVMFWDPLFNYYEAQAWATQNCESFINSGLFDISDLSRTHDSIARYRFDTKEDSILFRLRWG